MKSLISILLFRVLLLLPLSASPAALPSAGFFLPDSLTEVTLHFKKVGNLILLPVTFNDTIELNLILDTGCRNIVLFGKRFSRLFTLHPEKKIQFSGLGVGNPVVGGLSLDNKVSIDAVVGRKIPVVIVPDQNLFESRSNVDGIIGYDIFIKFEVEINLNSQIITFRPALTSEISGDYDKITIRVEDSRPIIHSTIFFQGKEALLLDLMLDTGSSLGLLLKTSDIEKYPAAPRTRILGRGLNGQIQGTHAWAEKLLLDQLEVKALKTGIIYSPWHNYASVGMDIMKNYAIVFNYCKSYAGFRKL
ncbi:MAG: hypothetical protein C0490_02160 [Marivirga sp.]|nr:hypothetical protein [Marivirga sp.]